MGIQTLSYQMSVVKIPPKAAGISGQLALFRSWGRIAQPASLCRTDNSDRLSARGLWKQVALQPHGNLISQPARFRPGLRSPGPMHLEMRSGRGSAHLSLYIWKLDQGQSSAHLAQCIWKWDQAGAPLTWPCAYGNESRLGLRLLGPVHMQMRSGQGSAHLALCISKWDQATVVPIERNWPNPATIDSYQTFPEKKSLSC